MNKRHTPDLRPTLLAFALSLLVHCTALLLLTVQTLPPPAPAMKRSSPSTPVPLLSERELKRLRTPVPSVPPPEKKVDREQQTDQRAQVVDIPPPPVEKVPTESRFIAEFNSAVREEMLHQSRLLPQPEVRKSDRRSTAQGRDDRGKRRGRRDIKRTQPQPTQRDRSKQAPAPQGSQRPKEQEGKSKQQRSELHQLKRGEGPFSTSSQKLEEQSPSKRGLEDGAKQGTGLGRLAPTHYQSLLSSLGPQDLSAQDGSIDHVPDIKRGEKSALNTRESRYAFFFNRVKRAVSMSWNPAAEMKRLDPKGEVYGVRDRHTVLAIKLNPSGVIAQIKIERPSGIPDLDRTAISAFMQAQPFHNPPQGLIEEDGFIRFKFGFYLEISSRRFRLFR